MSFQYTIKDGPLEGKVYGPFPTGKGSVSVDSLLNSQPRMHTAYVFRDGEKKLAYGLYRLEKQGEEYFGIHVPSEKLNDGPQ